MICMLLLFQWSFGVTLWELMTLAHQPYADVDPFEMVTYLLHGYRMSQPVHCPNELLVAFHTLLLLLSLSVCLCVYFPFPALVRSQVTVRSVLWLGGICLVKTLASKRFAVAVNVSSCASLCTYRQIYTGIYRQVHTDRQTLCTYRQIYTGIYRQVGTYRQTDIVYIQADIYRYI